MSVHLITDYGIGDGVDATEAFQAAVRACARDGGGTIRVPAGEYAIGSVILSDNVTISLAPGATIRASPDKTDYESSSEFVGPDGERPLIFARDCQNVILTGDGTIDGRGTDIMKMDEPIQGHSGQSSAFPLVSDGEPQPRQGDAFLNPDDGTEDWPVAKPSFRPGPIVLFDNCTNVSVRNVTLRNMPAWTLSFRMCELVDITSVNILNNMQIPNCDGLCIENSRDVRVSDCTVRTCDDAITLIARDVAPPCANVTVTNCTLSSRACAIKLGSETAGAIRNCTFQNCVVTESNRGLGIQHRDGGDVSNVLFSDITIETNLSDGPWWGKAEPIYVTSVPRDESTSLGTVRNVRFVNITGQCENGALVYGHTDATIEHIRLDTVCLDLQSPTSADAVGGNFDLQPTSVCPPLFKHEVPAVYCENIVDLELVDIAIGWGESIPDYHTHGIGCVGVEDLVIDGFDGRPAHQNAGDAGIHLRESSTITVRNSRARPGTDVFLIAEETADERLFASNDLVDAEQQIAGEIEFTVTGNAEPR